MLIISTLDKSVDRFLDAIHWKGTQHYLDSLETMSNSSSDHWTTSDEDCNEEEEEEDDYVEEDEERLREWDDVINHRVSSMVYTIKNSSENRN